MFERFDEENDGLRVEEFMRMARVYIEELDKNDTMEGDQLDG